MIEIACATCKGPKPTNNFFICFGQCTCDKLYDARSYLPSCPACGNKTNHQAIKNNDKHALHKAYTKLANESHWCNWTIRFPVRILKCKISN